MWSQSTVNKIVEFRWVIFNMNCFLLQPVVQSIAAPVQAQQGQRRSHLSLTREQMLEAQEMFRSIVTDTPLPNVVDPEEFRILPILFKHFWGKKP